MNDNSNDISDTGADSGSTNQSSKTSVIETPVLSIEDKDITGTVAAAENDITVNNKKISWEDAQTMFQQAGDFYVDLGGTALYSDKNITIANDAEVILSNGTIQFNEGLFFAVGTDSSAGHLTIKDLKIQGNASQIILVDNETSSLTIQGETEIANSSSEGSGWEADGHAVSMLAGNFAINSGKAVNNVNGTYTAESFKALTDAIAEAEALIQSGTATEEELKAAQTKIEKAHSGLVKAGSGSDNGNSGNGSETGNDNGTSGTGTGSKDPGSGTGKADTSKTGTGVQVGKTYTVDGQDYQVTKAASGSTPGTVTFTKAKNAKKITVPDTVKLADGKTYNVTAVGTKAFTAKKIRTVTVGAKKVNKKFVKKYKKIFTKKNAGKKAKVK